jgi:uncharacterized protein with HEPN domain
MRPETLELLVDIRDAARYIVEDTAGIAYETFVADQRLRQAVLYSFLVIGEASNRLRRRDPELTRRLSEIEGAIAMRTVVIHGYDIVDYAIVWQAIQEKLPAVIDQVETMLSDGKRGNREQQNR